MAGVPTIPPLLCNTPPPIDFGDEDDDSGLPPTLALEDDDDDFGDFALATDMINEDGTNADLSSLPRTPLQFELSSSTTTSGFTDIPNTFEDCGNASITPPPLLKSTYNSSSAKEEDKYKTQLNEAYNYNIAKAVNAESDHAQGHDSDEEINNILEAQTKKALEDNKQTTIHSNDDAKITNSTSTIEALTPTIVEQEEETNKTCISESEYGISQRSPTLLPANVVLEDLADDSSDDECHRSSPKKSLPSSQCAPKDDFDAEDFFAIHLVDSLTPPSTPNNDKPVSFSEDINMNTFPNNNNNIINDLKSQPVSNTNGAEALDDDDDDFGDFADFASATGHINSDNTTYGTVSANETVSDAVASEGSEGKVEEAKEPHDDNGTPAANDDEDEADFDDFQDFCAAPAVEPTAAIDLSRDNAVATTTDNIDTEKCRNVVEGSVASIQTNDEVDDDDFGDFEAASFDTPSPDIVLPSTTTYSQAPPTITSANISERFGLVLKQLFPTTNELVAGNDKETKLVKTLPCLQSAETTLPFESIETAKALEFQWPQSEMRHALIRSIGIDSRNILFGENWNPSMPRFAANLSFNPLKPMKPQTAANTNNSISTADTMQYSTNSSTTAANMDITSYAMKTDVPDVDFDWQGTGLVNPLDGVKGETNARETETLHTTPPVARFDTPDDQHQSHTTFTTNDDDDIPETLDNIKNIEVMAAVTAASLAEVAHTITLPLDITTAQHFDTTQDANITSNNNNTNNNNNNSYNSKIYDNSAILSTLRLGANMPEIIMDDDDDDETVVTSTYAGPLKETHIYTPSKTELAAAKSAKAATINSEPIDFDYEIAAAGIIIDEKVVKKEYRDVEYNPGFSLEIVNEYAEELPVGTPTTVLPIQAHTPPTATEFDDDFTEFTEFQSVAPTTQASATASTKTSAFPVAATTTSKTINPNIQPVLPAAVTKTKESSNTPSRTNSPSIIDNMILSPAILLPQSIPIGGKNTKKSTTPSIEWGDSSANIDPDELARIEELFPQPKMTAAAATANLTPTHANAEQKKIVATTTISATVAMKEQDSTLNDDYWSEFVSVPAQPQLPSHTSRLNNNSGANAIRNNNNNNNQLSITANNALRSPRLQQHQQQQQLKVQRTLTPTLQQQKSNASSNTVLSSSRVSANATNAYNNSSNSNSNSNNSNSNDDDWSDFVSNTATAPPPTATASSTPSFAPAPQFNSAAWQNANFYNNPLGLYHQHARNATSLLTPQQQQLQLQQQIHVMQDFSTVPTTTAVNRPHTNLQHSNMAYMNNMQQQHSSNTYSHLQVGNARVAPSISLIPDLGFVAPALPVHTAFVNVLPKTSFNSGSNKK